MVFRSWEIFSVLDGVCKFCELRVMERLMRMFEGGIMMCISLCVFDWFVKLYVVCCLRVLFRYCNGLLIIKYFLY